MRGKGKGKQRITPEPTAPPKSHPLVRVTGAAALGGVLACSGAGQRVVDPPPQPPQDYDGDTFIEPPPETPLRDAGPAGEPDIEGKNEPPPQPPQPPDVILEQPPQPPQRYQEPPPQLPPQPYEPPPQRPPVPDERPPVKYVPPPPQPPDEDIFLDGPQPNRDQSTRDAALDRDVPSPPPRLPPSNDE